MKLTPYIEYLLQDAFSEVVGDVTVKNMFGGHGFYLDGRIFGFTIDGDVLVLKSNDDQKQKFESRGGEQFVYTGHAKKGPVGMPYWTVPEDILEDHTELATWVHASAALSHKKK